MVGNPTATPLRRQLARGRGGRRRGLARLSIVLTHRSPEICALVELVGYCPRGTRSPIVRFLCRHLQARVHVRVGRRFLRHLAQAWAVAG